jgi:hypothetical protein
MRGTRALLFAAARGLALAGVALSFLLLALPSACTPPPLDPRPPVPLSLQLVTRQSCGVLSGLDYETSCLAAVYVRVLDVARVPVHEECHVFSERPGELRELVRGGAVLSFARLSTNEVVTFEVRGLHDVDLPDGQTPEGLCARAPLIDERWLFWGESGPVDLAAYDDSKGALVRIVLDCRDCTYSCGDLECFGCPGFGAQCPAETPSSFCVPTTSCDKSCEDADDCFEGARQCIGGRCDVAQLTGGLCSPCGGGIACSDGLTCVARAANQPGFCAPLCPDEVCASGTRCNRLGNNLVLRN